MTGKKEDTKSCRKRDKRTASSSLFSLPISPHSGTKSLKIKFQEGNQKKMRFWFLDKQTKICHVESTIMYFRYIKILLKCILAIYSIQLLFICKVARGKFKIDMIAAAMTWKVGGDRLYK